MIAPKDGMHAGLREEKAMTGTTIDSGAGTYAAQTAKRAVLTQQTYTYREGKAKVTEHHYELPKGVHSNLVGSFSYRTVSPKAGQLKARIASESRKLKAQVVKDRKSGKISHKKRERIRCKMKYLQDQLNAEMAAAPVTRVVVHERDDGDEADAAGSTEAVAYDLLLSSRGDGDVSWAEAVTETSVQE